VNRGWISGAVPVLKLLTRDKKSQPRPAFNKDEIAKLLLSLEQWAKQTRTGTDWEMRQLLRDIQRISWDEWFTRSVPTECSASPLAINPCDWLEHSSECVAADWPGKR
jgi:hypothetical protein